MNNPFALLGMLRGGAGELLAALCEAAADADKIGPPSPAPPVAALLQRAEAGAGLPPNLLGAVMGELGQLDGAERDPFAFATAARDTAARLAELRRERGGVVPALLELVDALEDGAAVVSRIVGAWLIISGRQMEPADARALGGIFGGAS